MPIKEKLRNRREFERINNTERVQDFPKRITVFVLSRKSSLLFEAVEKMESLSYLRLLLKKLESPEPVNALEVEARDLVKFRISKIEQTRQEKKDKSSKQSTSTTAKKQTNQDKPARKTKSKKK